MAFIIKKVKEICIICNKREAKFLVDETYLTCLFCIKDRYFSYLRAVQKYFYKIRNILK